MVGAMAGAKANEDEVSDSMIIDRQISYFTYREGINEQHTARHPGTGVPCRARVRPTSRYPADWTLRWATTWTSILDNCADMNGAPLLRAHRRASLGAAGRHPWGWRRIQARRSTCLLLLAVQRRRVESLVLGALSSSPVHRALVLVLGTNIAVLLDCSKSSRQCSLPYLLLTASTCSPDAFRRRLKRRMGGGDG